MTRPCRPAAPSSREALARNVLLDADAAHAEPLAAYVRAAIAALDAVDERRLLAGDWSFADPSAQGRLQEQVP